jgi:hypothetical protein
MGPMHPMVADPKATLMTEVVKMRREIPPPGRVGLAIVVRSLESLRMAARFLRAEPWQRGGE